MCDGCAGGMVASEHVDQFVGSALDGIPFLHYILENPLPEGQNNEHMSVFNIWRLMIPKYTQVLFMQMNLDT